MGDPGELTPSQPQQRVITHVNGPLLVTGPPGSGRTEALARRHAALVRDGAAVEEVLVLSARRTARTALRERADELLGRVHGELWILTHAEFAERLLREYAIEAEIDPFFTTVAATDRLAMLLERIDELPLRRHAIRGNPTGLLSRLLARIDALKLEGVTPGAVAEAARLGGREASDAAGREKARREAEFADLFSAHDRILHASGAFDAADLRSTLARLLANRPDIAEALTDRFSHVLVDELEDACPLDLDVIVALVGEGEGFVAACDPSTAVEGPDGAEPALAVVESRFDRLERIDLSAPVRFGARIARVTAALDDGGVADVAPDDVNVAEADPADPEVRFWSCVGERAQADALADEVAGLLTAGACRPEQICVLSASGWSETRVLAAGLEERGVPFRYVGDAAFFGRAEIRDVLAWLRMLSTPSDAPAAVRALTRPPIELRSADLARVTMIARRRKVDMVEAVEAALESPQLRPEARDRLQAFLRLRRAAAAAMERMRADVFVRRLIERVGVRRHRLFAASPEAAERLVNLSGLAEMAAEWMRREPRGSSRDFVRHITAVADAGELGGGEAERPAPGAVVIAEPDQVKGLEFERVYLLGLRRGAIASRAWEASWVPPELRGGTPGEQSGDGAGHAAAERRIRLARVAMTRARRSLVLSWPEAGGSVSPSQLYTRPLEALGAGEETHTEQLFGPAEGLHATYRMIRDEVLETSWSAGGALSEMRLDTAHDVDRAVARFLELIKLSALIQSPATESQADTLAAINEQLRRIATPEQRAALEASALDAYVAEEERERSARGLLARSRTEPSLEEFIPRSKDGIALSASDIDLYRTCPLKYKFARVFAIPQEPTINQRFGILLHNVLERFHTEQMHETRGVDGAGAGEIERLLGLFEAGWRRSGFGSSDDELQYRDRGVAALARYVERQQVERRRPVWLERNFSFTIDRHQLRGRVDRVDRAPGGGYELIDYKTGQEKSEEELVGDLQLALYRVAAREAWQVDAEMGSYWYVLADSRVPAPAAPDDAERVERTVLEVAGGIESQDFEPRPSHEICSWCDYRLICPASEA
ncbi:ATP-dependent helicase [Thermoleophilia bacterium SCSIO 60948]|nr:ATP-dependent helicase [Thermoleophilia bacterium SCSIO 60948]